MFSFLSLSNKKYAFLTMFSNLLGFTKTVSSMWAMTLLSLYTRVQVTILGRHLYLDFARSTHGAQLQVNLCSRLHILCSSIFKQITVSFFSCSPVTGACTLDCWIIAIILGTDLAWFQAAPDMEISHFLCRKNPIPLVKMDTRASLQWLIIFQLAKSMHT